MTVGPPLAQCLMWWASGPGGDAVAAGEGASFVAGDQGGALCCGDKPFQWGDVEWGTVSVEEDAGEHAVAGDHAGAADAQWSHPGHVADIEILFVEIVKVEIEHTGIVVPRTGQVLSHHSLWAHSRW